MATLVTKSGKVIRASLIGKVIYPIDNSYSHRIEDKKENVYLAGTFRSNPKPCIVVSEPYQKTILTPILSNPKIYNFITVLCMEDHKLYVILYLETYSNSPISAKLKV